MKYSASAVLSPLNQIDITNKRDKITSIKYLQARNIPLKCKKLRIGNEKK